MGVLFSKVMYITKEYQQAQLHQIQSVQSVNIMGVSFGGRGSNPQPYVPGVCSLNSINTGSINKL